jgi:3-oxoacyl-[acyl-carrier-protein] synthase-3
VTLTVFIKDIAAALAKNRIDNVAQAAQFGRDENFVREKLGPLKLARKGHQEDTSDLACRAVRSIGHHDFDLQDVDGRIVCTQIPDGHGLPHTSAIVHGALGLKKACAAFDIGLGCSGYVYSLATARGMMESYGLRSVLVVTSDPYSKIINPADMETALLFGDGATATWLVSGAGADEELFAIGHARFATDGSKSDHLRVGKDGFLHMKGREIFTFAAVSVPEQILALLAEAGHREESVDQFILHQGSRYIVETICARLRLPAEKVPIDLGGYGNTISSSIPMILARSLDNRQLKRIVVSGFGVGLSIATMILERGTHE